MPYPVSSEKLEKRSINGFFCRGCGTILLSLFRHDCKECFCGNMVDGGQDYVRRGYQDADDFSKVVEIGDLSAILTLAELGAAWFFDGIFDGSDRPIIDNIKKHLETGRLQVVDKEALIDGEFKDELPPEPTPEELAREETERLERQAKKKQEIEKEINDIINFLKEENRKK